MSIDDVVGELKDGMTIGIGGWGPRRKPMALVRAILNSDLKDLTVVSWGGADVGLLARAGKIRKLVYAFVSLDSVPLEPNFQKARQEGTIPELVELDEGMFQTGLQAAAQRLPFLPMRAGLGSDVLVNQPWIRTVTSPYADAEELVAVPALRLDVALVHLNRADCHGNAAYLGPDPYFDDLFCMAADRAFLSCEQVVDTAGLTVDSAVQRLLVSRMMVDGVVETPHGAHFTTCTPDYERDEKFQRAYAAAAGGTEEECDVVEGWIPFPKVFDVVAWGKRHVMMGATQIDRHGNQNISAIGDFARPKRQLLGSRGAPGNTVNNRTSYWVPRHSPRVFVERVDVVSGVGPKRAKEAGPAAARFNDIHRIVSNLGVFDVGGPDDTLRLLSVHPGVTVDEVRAQSGCEISLPDGDVPSTREPTTEELVLIREVLDPRGLRLKEVAPKEKETAQ